MKIKGFTLAELLITLNILAVIAAYTIPKVLASQQNNKYNAIAKEAIGMVSNAYFQYQQQSGVTTAFVLNDLSPYFHYVSLKTTGLIDDTYTDGSLSCNGSTYTCYVLHSGAVMAVRTSVSFGGADNLRGLPFHIDPDGIYSNTTNGPGKAVSVFIYYNGRVSDRGSIPAGTINSLTSYGATPTKVPPWFSWN